MTKKITLTDIASLAKVSPGTVYKALANNKGVSETKRQEILQIARDLNYAGTPKNRKDRKIAVALFPEPVGDDQFFYQYIWEGLQAREQELSSRLKIINVTFDGTIAHQKKRLDQILNLYGDVMSALLTIVWNEEEFSGCISKCAEMGIKLFTLSTTLTRNLESSLLVDPYKMGKLSAELMGMVLPDFSRVIVIGTRRDIQNHAKVVRGFYDQLSEMNSSLQVIEIYESKEYPERLISTLEDLFTNFPDVRGLYANNARSTAMLLGKMEARKNLKELFVIGSELFRQSEDGMRNGLLNAVISQNPFKMAYNFVSLVFNNLVLDMRLERLNYCPCSLYLSNNLPILEEKKDTPVMIDCMTREFRKDVASSERVQEGITDRAKS